MQKAHQPGFGIVRLCVEILLVTSSVISIGVYVYVHVNYIYSLLLKYKFSCFFAAGKRGVLVVYLIFCLLTLC